MFMTVAGPRNILVVFNRVKFIAVARLFGLQQVKVRPMYVQILNSNCLRLSSERVVVQLGTIKRGLASAGELK